MGLKDLIGSGSCQDKEKKSVTGRLKGIFGSLRRPENVASLDDERFIRDVDETPIEEAPSTPVRKRVSLDDYTHISAKIPSMDNIPSAEPEVRTPEFKIDETYVEEPETYAELHISETVAEENVVDEEQIETHVTAEIESSVPQYYDFLPSSGPAVVLEPGIRFNRKETRTVTQMRFESIFDPDEPVSGMSLDTEIIETPVEMETEAEIQETTVETTATVETPDITVPEIIQIETETITETQVYVPNFVMVDETDTEMSLESVFPEEVLRAMDEEDSEMPCELELEVQDEESEYITMVVDDPNVVEKNGIAFNVFSTGREAQASGINISWGVPRQAPKEQPKEMHAPVMYL